MCIRDRNQTAYEGAQKACEKYGYELAYTENLEVADISAAFADYASAVSYTHLRFTTYENVETIPLTVIKKNLNREQYDRNKLINGVRRACYKRPIASDKLETMIDAIEGDIFNAEDKEISSTKIGEIVMSHLKDLDSVAYVRFASVYREFKDVSTFMDELKKFLN